MNYCTSLLLISFSTFLSRITVAILYAFLINKNNVQDHFVSLFSSPLVASLPIFSLDTSENLRRIDVLENRIKSDDTIPVLKDRDIEEDDALPFFSSFFSLLADEETIGVQDTQRGRLSGRKHKLWCGSLFGPWWRGFLSMCTSTFLWDYTGLNSALYWREWLWWMSARSYTAKSTYSGGSRSSTLAREGVKERGFFSSLASHEVSPADSRWYIRSQLPWWCSPDYLPSWWSSHALLEWKEEVEEEDKKMTQTASSPSPSATTSDSDADEGVGHPLSSFGKWWWGRERERVFVVEGVQKWWRYTKQLVHVTGSVVSPATVVLSALDAGGAVLVAHCVLRANKEATVTSFTSPNSHKESVQGAEETSRAPFFFSSYSPSSSRCWWRWCLILFGIVWNPILMFLPLYESLLCVEGFAIFGSLFGSWICLRALFTCLPPRKSFPFFFSLHRWMLVLGTACWALFCSLLLGVGYAASLTLWIFMLSTLTALFALERCRRCRFFRFASVGRFSGGDGGGSVAVCVFRVVLIFVCAGGLLVVAGLMDWMYVRGITPLSLGVFGGGRGGAGLLNWDVLFRHVTYHLFLSGPSSAVWEGDREGGNHNGGIMDHFPPSLSPYWYARVQIPYAEYQQAFDFLLLLIPVWIILSGAVLCFLFLYPMKGEENNNEMNVKCEGKEAGAGEGTVEEVRDKEGNTLLIKEESHTLIPLAHEDSSLHLPFRVKGTTTTITATRTSTSAEKRRAASSLLSPLKVSAPPHQGHHHHHHPRCVCQRGLYSMFLLPQLALLLSLCFKSSLLLPHLVWMVLLLHCDAIPFLPSSPSPSFSPGFLCKVSETAEEKREWGNVKETSTGEGKGGVQDGEASSPKCAGDAIEGVSADSLFVQKKKRKNEKVEKGTRDRHCEVTDKFRGESRSLFSEGILRKWWCGLPRIFGSTPIPTRTSSLPCSYRSCSRNSDSGIISASHSALELCNLCVVFTAFFCFASATGIGYSWLVQGYYLSIIFFFNELLFTALLLAVVCLWMWKCFSSFFPLPPSSSLPPD